MEVVKRSNYFPTSFFDDFLTKDLFDWSGWTSQGASIPRTNIIETDEQFMVQLAAPGMKKEDFRLELDNDMLIIQVENANTQDEHNVQYMRREFNYQNFKRSFHLPNTVEIDKIEAQYKDGLLNLNIPKKEEARRKPVKTISIS